MNGWVWLVCVALPLAAVLVIVGAGAARVAARWVRRWGR